MVDHIKFTTEIVEDWKSALTLANQDEYRHCIKRIRDASTSSQLQSKLWLVSEIVNLGIDVERVLLLAGWYANFLTPLLVDELGVKYILNLEIDPDVKTLTYKFNNRIRYFPEIDDLFRTKNQDATCLYRCEIHDVMFEPLKYRELYNGDFDLVINSSCEHMYPMSRFRKLNKSKKYIYVLQSTDEEKWDDHINCVSSPEELADQAEIVDVMYSGTLELNNGMNRFMVIGR